MSVLETEQSGGRFVNVIRPDHGPHLVGAQPAVRSLERAELEAGDHRRARHLVLEDVAVDFEDDFRSRLGMAEEGAEVAHRPAGDEERCLLADHLRGAVLQAVNGRIFIPDVIPDLGGRHGGAHRLGG